MIEYSKLAKRIIIEGLVEKNVRTGHDTRLLIGTTICLYGVNYVPAPGFRSFYPAIAGAELTWMLSGEQHTKWLSKHTNIWKAFEDNGIVKNAYGYRMRRHFNRDQLAEAIKLIKKDESSRQCLMVYWDASLDGLGRAGIEKNVPCPFAVQFLCANEKLSTVVYQRSADFIVGLPYDIMVYSMLNMAIAAECGKSTGNVIFMIGDCHVYDEHEELLAAAAIDENHEPVCMFKRWSISEISKQPDGFVEHCKNYGKKTGMSLKEKIKPSIIQ